MSPKETVAPSALMRVLKPVAYFSLSPVSYDVLPPDLVKGVLPPWTTVPY